jgi:hypothetical protein
VKQLRKRSLTYYKNLSRKMGTATSTQKLYGKFLLVCEVAQLSNNGVRVGG